MGIAKDLRIAARRWMAVRGEASPSILCAAERDSLRRTFAGWTPPADDVRGVTLHEIDAASLPWTGTGIDLAAGDWVSTFAAGRSILSDALAIWIGAGFQVWVRIGETGDAFRGTRATNTFRADRPGRLYLAAGFPGQWGDRQGRVSTALADYASVTGGFTVAVVRWSGDAASCLGRASSSAPAPLAAMFAAELSRQEAVTPAPEGWSYLWFLGPAEAFRSAEVDGHGCIACDTDGDASILQREAPMDLLPGTRIAWSWKVDELPSSMAEDSAASHDYLSVAVEFENGRDITYTWSRELPAGTGYWCPLPTWKDREYHVVLRSGDEGLGTWIDEDRDLVADYRRYIGEPPGRIVRVWLIAVSIFQKGRGRVAYRDLRLVPPGKAELVRLG